jgi:acylphosphatase
VMAARRWIVRGRVQGVGFRWSVRRRAEALGVVGFARNLADGGVEVVARGDPHVLDELERYLMTGPRLASVDAVENIDVPHDMNWPNSFETL